MDTSAFPKSVLCVLSPAVPMTSTASTSTASMSSSTFHCTSLVPSNFWDDGAQPMNVQLRVVEHWGRVML